MRRFAYTALTALLAATSLLAGCEQTDPSQATAKPAQVCVDAQQRRVSDDDCLTPRPGGGAVAWYYLTTVAGQNAPAIGDAATGGSYIPTNGLVYHSATETGVVRTGVAETLAKTRTFVKTFGADNKARAYVKTLSPDQ
jgi:hypothetical protein